MSGDGLWDAQRAIYARLTGVAPPIASGRIFDDAPQDVAFPFIEIGESVAEEQDVDGLAGTAETITLYVYSRHRGAKEIKQIMSQIKAELHKTQLNVLGRSALAWWAGSLTRLDPDGLTRQGIIRIRVSSYQDQ